MRIRIIAVGKLKENYLVAGLEEYLKRIKKYAKIELLEVNDEAIPDKCSLAQETIIKVQEGRRILDKIKQDDYCILLDLAGKSLNSEQLAEEIERCMIDGKPRVDFIIGGSLGISQEVIDRANLRLSISKMTFPHQLVRLIIAEQIYRAFKIIRNEKYHK